MMDKVAVMNKARERYRLEHEAEVKEEARVLFKQYKKEPLFIAGIALYWAEGKTTPREIYNLELNNSDPNLLRIYCSFLRKYLNINKQLFRARLFLYPDLDELKTKTFWSKLLCIPTSQFIKSYISESRSSVTKNKLVYGTCSVFIANKDLRMIMATWIKEFLNLYLESPR